MGRRRRRSFEPDPPPLELGGDDLRGMISAAGERIVRHLATLPSQPMHAVAGGKKLARSLREPMPERAVPLEKLLSLLFGRVIPASLNTASPGYMAYIPGGGLPHSAVADLIAGATNRYVGLWRAAPGLVQLESNVVDWFCAMLGLPAGSGGVLTTGGSMANLIAVITARRERLRDIARGVIYMSDQAHHSVRKAALLAGLDAANVRALPSTRARRLSPRAVEEAIAADRRAGLTPFMIVATAGTTNTGTIDALGGLAAVAKRQRMWLHVDAAYGGFFALTARGQAALRGISHADSVTLDPHKGLFLPYGTGCLVVRDREALRRTHHVPAPYLPPMQTDPDLVDFCELSPELSRGARGLRVWLPLKMHGVGAFRAALDEKMDLAVYAAERLAKIPGIDVLGAPELSLVTFRARLPRASKDAESAMNRRLLSAINARQRVLLTGATLAGRFALRICILSFRTHREHVDMCLEDVRGALGELHASGVAPPPRPSARDRPAAS